MPTRGLPTGGKFSTQPLYLQVRDRLAQWITTGVWKPGAALPNEQDLARKLGVSTGTVRKALDSLEVDRLVLRRQGRGTFVIDQAAELSDRFCNLRSAQGHHIAGQPRLLEQTTGSADDTERERLQLSAGELVVRSTRIRHHDGRPLIYESARLALSRFPGLESARVQNYRILALAQNHGVHLARALEGVSLVQATAEVAEHLSVEPRTTLLKIDRLLFALNGLPIEWRVGLCHLGNNEFYQCEMG